MTSSFTGVSNPVGDTIKEMVLWGDRIILPGSIMVIYGIVRIVYRAIRYPVGKGY